jgi:isochorismate synthase EntC
MEESTTNSGNPVHQDLTTLLPAAQHAVLLRERDSHRLVVAGGIRYAYASVRELQEALHEQQRRWGFFARKFEDDYTLCWIPEWVNTLDEYGSHAEGSLEQYVVDDRALQAHMRQMIFVTRSEWRSGVRKVQREIAKGNVRKVVLSRWAQAQADGRISIAGSAERLLALAKDTTAFVLQISDETWLGATPEMLFHRDGYDVRVDSLAGTIRESQTLHSGFSDKELLEQELVTEFVTDELRNVASQVSVSPIEQRGAAGLLHAHSEIRARLNENVGDDELIAALHPTPAVCGLPRAEANDLIREIEKLPRGYYSGVLGWTDGRTTTAWVMLRCAMVKGANAEFFGGAGIVAQSDSDLEFDECGWKMETAFRAIFDATPEMNFPERLS